MTMVAMVALGSRRLFPSAAVVAVTLIQSHVLPTQPLDPDSGSQDTPHFVQKTVAARVSGGDDILNWRDFVFAGVVTSPNFPGYYPHNLDKTEKIQVESGKILRLEFTQFAIHGYPAACDHDDYVKITDGDGITLIDKICGFSGIDPSNHDHITKKNLYFLPPIITTRSNRVEIFFHTNGGILEVKIPERTSNGWSLSWSAETPGLKALICPYNLNTDREKFVHFLVLF